MKKEREEYRRMAERSLFSFCGPAAQGKFMQEFESWRVKDLEARNKREKALPSSFLC